MVYKKKELDDNKLEKFYVFYSILVRWVWIKQNKIDFYVHFLKSDML